MDHGAHVSDHIVVIAKTNQNPRKKAEAFSAFLLDREMPGISLRKLEKVGILATPSFEVTYVDVKIPKDRLIGEKDRGFYGCWEC